MSYYDATNHALKVAQAVVSTTVAINYGDGSPVVLGAWPGSGVLPLEHAYPAEGNYTALITATDGVQTDTATSPVVISAPPTGGLSGALSADSAHFDDIITYTLVVSNANVTQTLHNVIITGSAPLNSVLRGSSGLTITSGGDYGNGYARTGPLDLSPGQTVMLTWMVHPNSLITNIATRGHAAGDGVALHLASEIKLVHSFLPISVKSGP